MSDQSAKVVAWLGEQRQAMIDLLETLVNVDSGSYDKQGTDAAGLMAPDLTHVASRRTIAAGVLPNTPQALAAWISDPQHHKPGSHMPPAALPPDDLQALVSYLGTLR